MTLESLWVSKNKEEKKRGKEREEKGERLLYMKEILLVLILIMLGVF